MKRRTKKLSESEEQLRAQLTHVAGTLLHPEMAKWGVDEFHQGLVNYVASDEPLTRKMRDFIADELERLYFGPNPDHNYAVGTYPDREAERKAEYAGAEFLKWALQTLGMTATEAEQEVAEELCISVEALRKRLQRTRSTRPKTKLNCGGTGN